MARYAMRQRVWSLTDAFTVRDDAGNDAFQIKQKAFFAIGETLTFADAAGNPLLTIKQKQLSWGPTFEIIQNDEVVATVKKKLLSLRERFNIDTPGGELSVTGSLMAHEYTIDRAGSTIATVSKQWFTWNDIYGIEVADREDAVLILAVCVVIDMVCHPDSD